MKKFLVSLSIVQYFLILTGSMVITIDSFVVSPHHMFPSSQPTSAHTITEETTLCDTAYRGRDRVVMFSSTSTRPLYDGTNYTFPDTRTPAGVAELLEVSFVHACMQLASGYVDVLKMFIAASIGAYEAGFSIDCLLEELENNKDMPNTANRPLMDEEKMLRRDWLCVAYLTLSAMGYEPTSPLAADVAKKSIPEDIQKRYGIFLTKIGEAYKNGTLKSMSVEEIASGGSSEDLSPLEKAVLLQSLKVATLTPTVADEAKEATYSASNKPKEVKPPTPLIEGAF